MVPALRQTADAAAHAACALRGAATRKQFNLTPIGELPALGERWVKVIEDLQAGVARGREVRAYQQEHGGQLPPQYTDVTASIMESRAA
ncbi:hypothetical protein ACWC4C_45165 [Streptomyces olivaceoviridis]